MFKDAQVFSGFSVSDIGKAKKFYGETLGLKIAEKSEGLELQFAGGGKAFIYAKPDHTPASFTILNIPVKNVETAVAGLKERGVRFEIYDKPGIKTDDKGIARGGGGPTIAWFKDPAGNILSVVESK